MPVAAAGDLELAIRLARVVHRRQMLAPVLEPADRAADMPRSERDQEVLGIELAAGAKAAPGIILDQVDLGRTTGFRLAWERADPGRAAAL